MNTIQKIWKGSPNFWTGRKGYKPELIVIHIMDGTLPGTDAWFANPASQVSAHYGIGKSGEIHQYVKEEDAAWHAGRVDAPSAKLVKASVNPNLYTIGIEHEGKPEDIWTDAMKQASASLIREICQRWQIPIDRNHIIGHCEIYSKKPNCPSHDKKIINELVALANNQPSNQQSTISSMVEEGIKKIEEGLTLIKQTLK
jgi:N-acetyl-anhydromuramyl-L-alanine amidase AmpD